MTVTAAQLRGARAMLGWTSGDLALRSRVHRRTVRKLESGEATPQRATIAKIVAAIEAGGIEFIEGGGVRPKCQDGISTPEKSA
jgi:transcriptional regulator with XRE-family HTH domain